MRKNRALCKLPMFAAFPVVLNTLTLPSVPCSCIVDQKIEKRCIDRNTGDTLEKIQEGFNSQAAKCPPSEGCSRGHAVEYRYCDPVKKRKSE